MSHETKNKTLKDFPTEGGVIAYGHDLKSLNGTYSKADIAYPERAIIMADQDDYVFLNKKTDPTYLQYLKYMGIGPKQVIYFKSNDLHHGLDKMRKLMPQTHFMKNVYYSPFISRAEDYRAAASVGMQLVGNAPEITNAYYDKASFKAKCQEIGIQTAIGDVFEKTGDTKTDAVILKQSIERFLDHPANPTREVIIRACNSEGGYGIFTVNRDNLEKILPKVAKEAETKFLVEIKEDVVASPSAIGLVSNEGVSLFAYTTQILDTEGVRYQGTLIDEHQKIPEAVRKQFLSIGNQMQKDGFRGPFGIDFIKTREGRFFPCENNARVTAGFYPWELKQRIEKNNGDSFSTVMSMNHESKAVESFRELLQNQKLRSFLYKKGAGAGIVPFRVSDFEQGEVCYVVLGNSEKQVKKLSQDFQKALKEVEFLKNLANRVTVKNPLQQKGMDVCLS